MSDRSYNSIVNKLARTRNSVGRWLAFEGLIDLLSYIGGFVFILWLLTELFWPGPAFRISLIIIGIAGIFILLSIFILKPLIKKQTFVKIALKLEKCYGKLQSRLIASLELYDKLSDNKENYSVELIEKTIEEAGEEIKDLDFSVAVHKRKKPYQRLALSVLAIILALSISSQTLSYVAMLYSQPLADIPRPTNLELSINPLNPQAIKNDDVTINIIAAGEKVRRVDFNFKFDDGKWVTVPAERLPADDGDSLFIYTFRKVKRNIAYYAQAKNVKSSTGKITVIDPPNLVDISVALDFPAYTRLKTQQLPNNDGSVTAIKGTDVSIKGKLNKPAQSAFVVFDNGKRRSLAVDGNRISGRFVISRNGSYHIQITDSTDLQNPDPIEFDLVCLDDYPPQVQITFPAVDIDLDEYMLVPIETALYDDFGFSKLELVYWTYSEGRESNKIRQILKKDFTTETDILYRYDWYLEQLHLMPSDLVYYYLEIFDNDAVSGSKSSVSKTFSARLPSLDEIMADITGSQEEVFRDFDEVVNNQKELKDELKELSREMLKLSEIDWEKKQQIQSTLDRQKDIAEKLDQISEQMEETIEKFEKNQLATTEMLDKMEEIRELFEKVATPELKEAMRKLQEALQKMDPELIQEAMKNFELSVEQINENLDRMLAILKKFQLEQKLDTLAKMAQKLADQQQQINDQLGQCNSDKQVSDLEKPQQQQEQGLQNLREQFEQTKDMNQDQNMLSQQDMQNADDMVNSPELDQSMSQMMSCLGMCNKKKSSKTGSQLQQNFQEMAQMFQQMLEQMQSQQMEMLTKMIRKAITDILYLSFTQEEVIDSGQEYLNRLEGRREIASQQKDIETATNRVAQNVSDLTKESLFINMAVMERLGEALKNMQEAIERLNTRYPNKAKSNQVMAMSSLNQSVEVLMSSLDKLSQCQSSSCTGMQSMMKKLSQAAQAQQMLNQQSQMMMPMPGQGMSLAQQQALQRMAAQQESIRKGLQEMLDEFANSEGGNILGRIDELGQEMKKVSEQLQAHNLDQPTIQRQEKILSRLLDAQKSVHRRDYSRKRQARSTEDIIRRGPGSLKAGKAGDEKLAEDIKKALAEKYPRRYENQIKEYFKAITEDSNIAQ